MDRPRRASNGVGRAVGIAKMARPANARRGSCLRASREVGGPIGRVVPTTSGTEYRESAAAIYPDFLVFIRLSKARRSVCPCLVPSQRGSSGKVRKRAVDYHDIWHEIFGKRVRGLSVGGVDDNLAGWLRVDHQTHWHARLSRERPTTHALFLKAFASPLREPHACHSTIGRASQR